MTTIVDNIIRDNPNDKPLSLMQEMVQLVNEANGWFDKGRSFGDDIALLHSEVSEAFEAYRSNHINDMTIQLCEKNIEGEHGVDHICKPEGIGSELADILVRLLDTCERYNIDLEDEFNRKLRYNATRGYRHGNRLV